MKFCKSTLKLRIDLLSFFHQRRLKIAEVGVYKGYFSKQIAERMSNQSMLHLVDSWDSPLCEGQMVGSEEDYKELQSYFKSNSGVRLEKMYSQQACMLFEDESFDLVYLDAEHTYDGVLSDISLWYPKVKSGGILAGHDVFAPEHIGVTQAVMDSHGLVFVIPAEICPFTSYTVNPSWYIVKS